jgi:hypothetical protein
MIGIGITNSSISKVSYFREVGELGVWRYNSGRLETLRRQDGAAASALTFRLQIPRT